MNTYTYEFTDTYAGETNYDWVRKGSVEAQSLNMATRAIKLALGLNGIRCKREDWADMIVLRPVNSCTILFIREK